MRDVEMVPGSRGLMSLENGCLEILIQKQRNGKHTNRTSSELKTNLAVQRAVGPTWIHGTDWSCRSCMLCWISMPQAMMSMNLAQVVVLVPR